MKCSNCEKEIERYAVLCPSVDVKKRQMCMDCAADIYLGGDEEWIKEKK